MHAKSLFTLLLLSSNLAFAQGFYMHPYTTFDRLHDDHMRHSRYLNEMSRQAQQLRIENAEERCRNAVKARLNATGDVMFGPIETHTENKPTLKGSAYIKTAELPQHVAFECVMDNRGENIESLLVNHAQ